MFNQSIFLIEDPAELFCVDNVSHGLMKRMGFVVAAAAVVAVAAAAAVVVAAVAVAVVVVAVAAAAVVVVAAQLQHENLFHSVLEAIATNSS